MRNLVSTYVEQFRQDRQKQIRLVAILAALAVVVAGVVFWQLHNTGVAMSNEVYCGQEEHVHDENCYETTLVCGLDESEGHVHDDSCYETVETLVCTDDSEDHVHTADCYETTQELICGLEEAGGHTHTDDCCETVLVCDIPEHTHTIECMIDETADVETASDWEATLPEELSGVWADDMVAVAESQVGYTESTANFQLAEDGETRQGYTRYGAWYGNEYGDWDAMFASFCLNYAGVPEEDFPEASGSYAWITELEDIDLYVPGDNFTALPGDLVFFDTDEDGEADVVGIVKEIQEDADFVVDEETGETVTTTVVTVIEGNSEDAVQENEYRFDDAAIIGYGILPEQTTAESVVIADFDESVVDEDYDNGILTGEKNFLYEDDDLVLKVNVAGSVELPESAVAANETENVDAEEVPAPSWEDITMEAAMAAENNEAYKQMLAYAEEQDGELYQLFNVNLSFSYGEEEIDISNCEITVDAAPTQALLKAAMPDIPEDAVVELGVIISMLSNQDKDIVELDSTTVTSENQEDAVLTADLNGNDFGIMVLGADNPEFTVQFYANIDKILTEHSGSDVDLAVIETHTDKGAVLPSNNGYFGSASTEAAKKYNLSVVELTPSDNAADEYILDSESVLTKMYEDESYDFLREPNTHYMNKLEVNADYELIKIWVLKDGYDPESMDKNDWDIYECERIGDTEEYTISFTMDPDKAEEGKVLLVEDGSVFRFEYDGSSNEDAYIEANLYDYNITDGNVYADASFGTWTSGPKYLYTAEQGINSSGNYSGSGTKLAFGNNNTGTGLGRVTWGNEIPNAANNDTTYGGLLGCTFGLVSGLDDNGHIVYSNGIIAPKLFNESGSVTGKQAFNGAELIFDREGDTYTLTTANLSDGTTAVENLDTFTHYTNYKSSDGTTAGSFNIYSNNFWPLDNVADYTGKDALFGNYADYSSNNIRYFGNETANMPPSDDSTDHNSYFGMHFEVEFSLTSDYCGPLEYFFFGDDDMWVFLTDETNNTTTLVLDIGGVHSSVGEHVDLWDYIDKTEWLSTYGDDDEAQKHNYTLSVFYTERGASGSTCYIRYVLPTVSSVTPVEDAGDLVIEKQVAGDAGDKNQEFTFTIDLVDSEGVPLTDEYYYYLHEGGETYHSGEIKSGGTFTLKDGWTFEIHNVPVGSVATVTETSADGYSTTYEVTAVNAAEKEIPDEEHSGGGTTTSGNVYDGGTTTFVFTNTAGTELPSAGGTGIWAYTVIGVCLVGGAATALIYRKRRAVRA